jgi:predicted nucleic-acid-binding Zn-ribbon protein
MIKQPKYFLIRCKKCGNSMKYMTLGAITELSKKNKRCVYCGFTNNIKKSLIREIEK